MSKYSKVLVFSIFLLLEVLSIGATSGDQKRLKTIQLSMDFHELPCVDFYNYACGEWQYSFGQDSLQVLDYQVEKEMEYMISNFANISQPKFLQTVYNYYQTCEELKEEEDPLEYLKWLHQHENVTWSLIASNTKDTKSLDWIDVLAITRKYGYKDLFLYTDIVERRDDPLKLIIDIRRPPLAGLNDFHIQMLEWEDKMDVVAKEKFRQFQKELLKLTMDLIKSEEKDDVEFLLSSLSKPSVKDPQLITVKDLKMPWLNRYLSVLLDPRKLDENMQIYVHSVTYLKKIYDFFGTQTNQFLSDYIQWKFLKYLKHHPLTRERASCLQSTRYSFPMVMQWIYEKHHLELDWEVQNIEILFSNLKQQFKRSLLNRTEDLDADILQYLQNKIDKIQLLLANVSSKDLEYYYGDLYLELSDYYGNLLKVLNFNFESRLEALSHSLELHAIELLELRSYDNAINIGHALALSNLPHLYPQLNIIYLPVTLLRSPYYEYGMSDLYTYSSIGFLLAHEIAKAFDQQYITIDADGIYNSLMFKRIQMNRRCQQFFERLQRNLTDDHRYTNDVFDDLVGLRLTYNTYDQLHPNELQDKISINANVTMTKGEIFFLNYAQYFCGSVCSQSARAYLLCDRVSKPLKHLEKFKQTFQCGDTK